MQQWEYKVLIMSKVPVGSWESAINALGLEGWELVATISGVFFFKRPKP